MNEIHEEIERIILLRHPRRDYTPLQVLRLRMIKLIEESLEAATCIALPRELSLPIDALSEESRWWFRNREWLALDFVNQRPSDDALAHLKGELADVFIIVVGTALLVGEITGEPFDIEQSALAKARADLGRA